MSTNATRRGFSKPIGHITQHISSHLCGKFKHLRYGRLFTEWRHIFTDEIGILYQPVRLSQGKLIVQTTSTQAALLAYFAPTMIERINEYLGSSIVESIQAQQGFTKQNIQDSRQKLLAPLSHLNQEHIEGIQNKELKKALERWGQWLETDKR